MRPHRAGARSRLVVASLVVAAGCAPYRAMPLDPVSVQDAFRARRLDDPGLAAWAREQTDPSVAFPPARWDAGSLSLAALWFHPALDVARAEVDVARAAVVAAGARPNPAVAARSEYVTNPQGDDPAWVAEIALDLSLETAGKRARRVDVAEAGARVAAVGVLETAWKLRSGVRRAWLDHAFARLEVSTLRAELAAARELVLAETQRLEAGESSRPEALAADVRARRLGAELARAETEVAATHAALAAAIAVPDEALRAVDLDPAPGELVDGAELETESRVLGRLDVRRALLEYEASEAAVRLEVARQYPDLAIGPGLAYDQGLHKILFGFSLPLSIFHRNEGPLAQAEALRAGAQARFVALEARAEGEIELATARYRGALLELARARDTSAAQSALAGSLARSLELGESDRIAVASARLEAALLAQAELSARRTAQQALLALEDSLQQPLLGSAPPPGPPSTALQGIRR